MAAFPPLQGFPLLHVGFLFVSFGANLQDAEMDSLFTAFQV